MRRRRFVLPGLAAVVALALVPGMSVAQEGPRERPGAEASGDAARAALVRAERALRGRAGDPAGREALPGETQAPGGRGPTLVLRDLAAAYDDLSADDRRRADRVLARPDESGGDGYVAYQDGVEPVNTCEQAPLVPSTVCVHWATESSDAVSPGGADEYGVPSYVREVRAAFDNGWDRIVNDGGYRAPLPDTSGPDNRLDVYLLDLAGTGYYGYCASDELGAVDPHTSSAYCVLDNDYAVEEYGDATSPLDVMRVTAVHELFHAVQFAYDALEDEWLMEASSGWVEDEIHDSVDDNRQFLADSPLGEPGMPLDFSSATYFGQYGAWIFLRHLTERYPDEAGTGLPVLVRDIWDRAAASGTNRGAFSIRAVAAEIRARGGDVSRVFQEFGVANRWPGRWYEEGAAYLRAPTAGRMRFTGAGRQRVERWPLHLSNTTLLVLPGSELKAKRWKARVHVNLPPTRYGYGLAVTLVRRNGNVPTKYVELGKAGNGGVTVPLSRRRVKRLEVTVTNASRRYRCWRGTTASCEGVAKDDGETARITVRAFR